VLKSDSTGDGVDAAVDEAASSGDDADSAGDEVDSSGDDVDDDGDEFDDDADDEVIREETDTVGGFVGGAMTSNSTAHAGPDRSTAMHTARTCFCATICLVPPAKI
jgi:hypothetical protein